MSASGRWYVVQTHAHAEHKALMHLMRQGFAAYLPRYLKRRRHARKVETVAAALFPRYLFVFVDLAAQQWRSIQSTAGVARLVCYGDQPASVPSAIVEQLKTREDERGFVQLPQRIPFAAGEKIYVRDGLFAACTGIFEGMGDRDRVAVLLDMLGRKVRVVLDADVVIAA
ncbi:MAG TPA: transcriptional activator RfaH [Pseudolabrys sp.]|nr:transcriptional activator RfaH [Pseudolabrys sp.]